MKTSQYDQTDRVTFPKGTIRKVYGSKARFCNSGCAESFREDRRQGLIYGCFEGPEPGTVIGWEEASLAYGHCAYCRSGLR